MELVRMIKDRSMEKKGTITEEEFMDMARRHLG
jgi:hypothetical protein